MSDNENGGKKYTSPWATEEPKMPPKGYVSLTPRQQNAPSADSKDLFSDFDTPTADEERETAYSELGRKIDGYKPIEVNPAGWNQHILEGGIIRAHLEIITNDPDGINANVVKTNGSIPLAIDEWKGLLDRSELTFEERGMYEDIVTSMLRENENIVADILEGRPELLKLLDTPKNDPTQYETTAGIMQPLDIAQTQNVTVKTTGGGSPSVTHNNNGNNNMKIGGENASSYFNEQAKNTEPLTTVAEINAQIEELLAQKEAILTKETQATEINQEQKLEEQGFNPNTMG